MGGVVTRSVIFGIGFVYPAYNTWKTLEGRQSPTDGTVTSNDDARREWLTYWVVFSFFFVLEEWIEWLSYLVPLYFIAKVAFILWLWAPQTKGAKYVYENFVRPQLKKHEAVLDDHINNLGTTVVQLGQRATARGKEYFPQVVRTVMAKTTTVAAFQNAVAARQETEKETVTLTE